MGLKYSGQTWSILCLLITWLRVFQCFKLKLSLSRPEMFPPYMIYYNFYLPRVKFDWSSPIDQSHRYGRHQAACREPAGSYDKTTRTAICFEHKTEYLLICAPYTRIVVFWHISNIPPMISQSQISCNTPTFYIAAIFVKFCYTIGSWLL